MGWNVRKKSIISWSWLRRWWRSVMSNVPESLCPYVVLLLSSKYQWLLPRQKPLCALFLIKREERDWDPNVVQSLRETRQISIKSLESWIRCPKLENDTARIVWTWDRISEQYTSYVTFSRVSQHTFKCHILIDSRTRSALHFIPSSCAHDLMVLILNDSPSYSVLSIFSLVFLFILLFTLGTLANEHLDIPVENDSLIGYENNNPHISEATDIFILESSFDNRSLNLYDIEFDDYIIGMTLNALFITLHPGARRYSES